MKVDVRCTPLLPKLAEAGARACYNSFDKAKDNSHTLVKKIMNAKPIPHLSVGTHGNILLTVAYSDDSTSAEISRATALIPKIALLLTTGSRNYLTVTTELDFPDSAYCLVVSGNPVAWKNGITYLMSHDFYDTKSNRELIALIFTSLMSVPEVAFFLDDKEDFASVKNPYLIESEDFSDTRTKLIVSDDFSDVLTEAERELHETATVAITTSRDMSMQLNRHDAGVSQMSQRYVFPVETGDSTFKNFLDNLTDAEYHNASLNYILPEGIHGDELMDVHLGAIDFDPSTHLWNSRITYNEMMEVTKTFYFTLINHQIKKGVSPKRANEQARSVLTNNIETLVYYTRPKWRWRHLINLRTHNHAQIEARRDVVPILELLQKIGWFNEYKLDYSNFLATIETEGTN